ncbi:fibronectin type III domain-containing protein [Phytohabitans kaempferiae]|uniref:Fibronectin type III domain-containing protein n=1 Tax=Phytohabitans kaempferiae TaxID=1620943 RepID=A0ABV6LXF4_9ACTN
MTTWGLTGIRRFIAGSCTFLIVVALTVIITGSGARAAASVPAGGMTAAQVNSMFAAYGDAGGHWTGGDSTVSVLLPDGRMAWLFSDTFLGSVNADGSRPADTPMVHNTLVVQEGVQLTTTLMGGSAAFPEPLVKPSSQDELAWVADAVVESGELRVLYNRFRQFGQGSLDMELMGTSLATFSLPGLTQTSLVDLPVGKSVQWGSAVLVDGSYTYIYGTSEGLGGMKFGHVARASVGGLGGAWQYWTGSGWSATESAAARLLSGVGNSFAVQKVGSQYVVVTQDTNTIFDPQFVAYTAASPTGPFSGPIQLLTAPEQQAGTEKIVYTARLHPDLARPGKLLMSYDVNSLNNPDNFADARLYRPRFVELDWPRPQPDPSTLPVAPTGVTVTADTAGVVHLRWTVISGATGYYVYRRDVTNGQTHFSRQRQRLGSAAADVGGLVTGHRYEFKVTAANAVGEGPFSATVAVTARVERDASVILLANTPSAVSGYYIVRFKDNAAVRSRGVEAFARELLAQSGGTLDRLFPLTLNGFSAALTQAQAIDLAGHPDVLDVQQDQVTSVEGGGVQGPAPEPSWGLDRIDQRDPLLDKLYHYPNDASNVHAYVLDSGIKLDHNDFVGRISSGRNTVDQNMNSDDCNGHGTHVAGTLGGSRWGVAKFVRLHAVKVLDCQNQGTQRMAVEGIEWVLANLQKPAVINMSLAWPASLPRNQSTQVDNAVKKAVAAGITVVAAAGNNNIDACGATPARAPEAITVAAMTKDGKRWTNTNPLIASNFGACVDLFAPGADIESAYIGGPNETRTLTGTSMATPHVAGAAAMLLQAHPEYSPADVAEVLLKPATPGAVQDVMGSPNLLLYIEQPPAQGPTNLTATSNPDSTIRLRWDGVSQPNVHYVVSQRDVTDGDPDFTPWTERQTGTSAVAHGLQEGHTYEFRVAAANSMGTGPQSNVASATARTQPPDAPTGLAAAANTDGTIALTWQPPAVNVWYWVYQRDVTAGETDFTKLPYPVVDCCALTAAYLTHGHEYEFKVAATNVGGEGPASDPARATSRYPMPQPPTGLTATAGDGKADLTWVASPTPNVWYWVYQRNVTEAETEFTKLPYPVAECCTMTAAYLDNNSEYEFAVSAIGQGGESTRTNLVRVTPRKPLPGKVTGLTATPKSDGTIVLNWSEPANGPHWYDVYQRDVTAGQTSFTKIGLPVTACCTFTVSLLTHAHRYEYKVGATNGQAGPLSDPVQAVSNYAPPAAPRNLTGRAAGDGSVDLDWDPPSAGNFYYWGYYRDVTAGQTAFTKLGLPTEKTNVSIGPLVNNHVYEFKVAASNQGGEGPASDTIRVTSLGGLPQPPSGLTAQAGDGKVTLRWTASPSPSVWYAIEHRPSGGAWQRIPLPLTTCCSYTMSFLDNGTTYEFRLRATNASGDSAASNVATARPMPPLPQPPSGLTAQAGDGKVTLRWTASPTANVYYWVEYRANGGAWRRISIPVTTCCTYTASLLTNGVTYDFRLRATNITGDSAPTNVATARPMPPAPQPPSGLTAQAGDGKVTLRWTASPTANVYYWVEYRANGGAWRRISIPVTTCCTYTASLLTNGVTYDFRLRATNITGDSAPTNVATARPLPPVPAAPSNLWARAQFNAVDLSWTRSPSPNVMYFIYFRNVTRNGAWVKATWPTPETSITMNLLNFNTTYDFRVTAANAFSESAASNTVRTTTLRGGCVAVGQTPTYHAYSGYSEVHATNSTRCTGTVYAVNVTANMLRKYSIAPWGVWETHTENWGPVIVAKTGYSTARISDSPTPVCAYYMTQAITTWRFANGDTGRSVSYSRQVLDACV